MLKSLTGHAFSENNRALNFAGHERFNENKNEFLKAFHKL